MFLNNPEIPKAVRWAQILFFLLALAMAVFGVVTLFRHNAPAWAAGLMLLDAVLLGASGWLITRCSRLFYLLMVGLVAGNAVLTVMDQFGWPDALVFAAFLALLILLVTTRRRFAAAV